MPDKSWFIFPVKIINIFETYELARGKLAKAEETSDLVSDYEGHGRGKRTKKRRRYSSSSTDSNFSSGNVNVPTLPSPPQHTENSFTLNTSELLPPSPLLLVKNARKI